MSVKRIIVCTNTQADSNISKFLKQHNVKNQNILHYQDGATFYTFNDDIVSDLITNAKVYHQKNLKSKDVDESLITEENVKHFLGHLEFYVDYPSENDLENITEKILDNLKHLDNLLHNTSYGDLHQKIKKWFEQPKGEYLTESRTKAMFCEIKSEKYREWLESYRVFFKNNDSKVADSNKRIVHIITERGQLLPLMKVYRSLQQNNFKILYASPAHGTEVQIQVIKAFELPTYTHLIIISPTVANDSKISEVCDILTNILHNRDYKKVIFVAEYNNKLVQKMKSVNHNYEIFKESLTLADLSKDIQKMLLNKKSITFQGDDISLEELITDHQEKYVTSDIVDRLIKGEKIVVGKMLTDLEEDISRYYVGRKFERVIKDVDGVKKRKEVVLEENIYNVEEKLILISDSAGTGKTTVLTHLALAIKQNNPRLWVVRIELNRCTKLLNNSLKTNKKLNLWDLLKCKHTTKPTNELETILFSLEKKVVIMLDGVDEISPDYSDLIFDLLVQIQKAENVEKTFVTTRPHMISELEVYSTATFFTLTPLTEQNQVDFFTNYWRQNLQLDHEIEDRCSRYARNLISKMFALMPNWHDKNEKEFTVTPLHARMFAEVFLESRGTEEWEGCKEYLNGGNEEPKLPERMNITKLYGMFIEKKRDIFMDKGNPSGNTTANQALMDQFEECLVYHRSLALEIIFSEKECNLFSCYRPNSREKDTQILKMGIVQKLDNKLNFVHRTFAEYLVAECILKEMQLSNMSLVFQMFLIDEVFFNMEYNILRQFLDNSLQNVTPPFPSHIFERYRTLADDIRNHSLIHRLAGEGNTEIIRLLLKCVGFIESDNFDRSPVPDDNTLTLLQGSMEVFGINIKDDKDRTPLHWSVFGGHLDTAKFLLEIGANIYANSEFGGTVLHLAVEENKRNIVEFLLEIGMDINIADEQGRTALYYAVERESCDIIQFLVDHGLNIDLTDDQSCTAVHLAAQRGTLTSVKFLVELGVEVNTIDTQNRTALHYAAETGNYDIVNFLVDLGMDINTRDRQGCTALHLASKRGSKDIVAFLVERGGDVSILDKKGRSSLHLAVLNSNSNTVEFLVQNGIDINIVDNEGRTALQFAAELRRWDSVKFLVQLGMNVNATDNKFRTILHYAVERGDTDIVDFIMRYDADVTIVDINGQTPLYVAVSSRNQSNLELLVQHGVDVDINKKDLQGRTMLDCAIRNESYDIVQFLIESGINYNIADSMGSTALHLAACQRSGKILEFLLERDIDINMKDLQGRTAIFYAIENNNCKVVELLVDRGLDINTADDDGNSALHYADKVDTIDGIIKFLIEHHAKVNVANKKGETPMHRAANCGNLKSIKLFLEHGADINFSTNEGNTALHLASQKSYFHIVTCLAEHGADVNLANKEGNTALHYAVRRGDWAENIVKCLLQHGADVNRANKKGETPIHFAANCSKLKTVEFLVEHNADINSVNNEGNTAVHLALLNNHFRIAKFLADRGADINVVNKDGVAASFIMTNYWS